MKKLPNRPDKIARVLEKAGCRESVGGCPLEVWYSRQHPDAPLVIVGEGTKTVFDADYGAVPERLTPAEVEFVKRFDAGMYPFLKS